MLIVETREHNEKSFKKMINFIEKELGLEYEYNTIYGKTKLHDKRVITIFDMNYSELELLSNYEDFILS